jgi:Xaa-Pro dipeptidase
MNIFEKRRERVYDCMAAEGIPMLVILDFEGRRNPTLRWLTGHPQDALLFLSADRTCILVPWDISMAMLYANADSMLPYSQFDRDETKAIKGAAKLFNLPRGSRIEIPRSTPYPDFLKHVETLDSFDVICRNDGIWPELEKSRAVKDEEEIKLYRQIAALTNAMTDSIEKQIRKNKIKTEMDAALFIEAESRKLGCEGTGFETLAAGPARSFGIHAFPAYTSGNFAGPGLSILDYGLKYAGYSSDVTLTFARPPLTKQQEKMLSLTEKAYALGLSKLEPGVPAREIGIAVQDLFGKAKKSLVHAMGHGIGLEAHEAPSLGTKASNDWVLEPGMVIALEPGLYDTVQGGCRLENDMLITEDGCEVLTNSRIIRL